jgi:DNA-binding transcriptional LysR family regulator
MNIDIRQMRAFLAVAATGSFTRAAAQLALSQPALTVQIRKLEEALSLRVFDRNTRSVALTRAGRELLPVLGRLVRELDSVVADSREQASARRGVVRLAVLPSIASGVLPEVIARFRLAHPDILFVLRDAIAATVNAATLAEEVDLGITGGLFEVPELEALLTTSDHMHAVFPHGHALDAPGDVSLADLAAHPLILMDSATSVRQIVDLAFAAAGLRPLIAAEATYMSTAAAMVRAGLGAAILPGSAMEVRAVPGLRSRRIASPACMRTITVIRRAGRTLPPASALFLEELKQALADPLDGGG